MLLTTITAFPFLHTPPFSEKSVTALKMDRERRDATRDGLLHDAFLIDSDQYFQFLGIMEKYLFGDTVS